MPDGLLLLAFALTLVVNAVLIGVAIRAMRPGGALHESIDLGHDRRDVARPIQRRPTAELPTRSLPGVDPLPRVVEPRREAQGDARADAASQTAALPRPDDVEPVAAEVTDSVLKPQPEPRQRTRSRPAAAPALPDPSSAGPSPKRRSATKAGSGNGRRRRFSLPPLDEDQDKVNRSIESFLSGGETNGDAETTSDREPDHPPTTVALVAIVGAAPTAAGEGPSVAGGDEARAMETMHEVPLDADAARRQNAVSAVKRALRAAARGTDRVETVGDDRFRVVLAATGELAARAYLRRVRANVEPLLEELEPPRRLAVSTATILGEPVDQANEVAERRLQAAIEATHDAGTDRRSEPRAAAD